MITGTNFISVLRLIGFSKQDQSNTWIKHYETQNCDLIADLDNNKPIYPPGLDTGDNTSNYFSEKQLENYVVFECVDRLLSKGYQPSHIFLEKQWSIGHTSSSHFSPSGTKSGRADISVLGLNGSLLFIIECKRAGQKYNEAKKALFAGTDIQPFTYFANARSIKWLQLYASDYDEDNNRISITEETIKCEDDPNVVLLAKKDGSIKLYSDASQAEDLWRVWSETYNCHTYKDLIFSKFSTAYNIGIKPIFKGDLHPFNKEDGVANSFAEILRHNSISDKENAFNKLLSLFICKFVDENEKADSDVVDFQYKEGTDDYYSLYERLLRLFHIGMRDFLKEDVFYLPDTYIPKTLKQYTGKERKNLEQELKDAFQKTKLLSCQVFAFREIYNEELFMQNGKILVEMVQLFQHYKLSYSSKHQFLGELFEQLLRQGFKQDEGQFFTPIPITRFIWNSIPYEKFITIKTGACPKVIDYACGSGHFLTEGISAVLDSYRLGIQSASTQSEKTNLEAITDETVSEYFYGTEKDNRLARVSKIALLLNGANKANIMAVDGLAHDESFLGPKNSFNILVANPPYAVDGFKEHLDKGILDAYDVLQYMSLNCDDIENVFVERINQLLSDGGIAAVILPNSILSADDKASVKAREILIKYFFIRAIVSLNKKTFEFTPVNTIVFFLEKKSVVPDRSVLLSDSITAVFSQEDLDDWEDKVIFTSYLNTIEASKEDFIDFIKRTKDYTYWEGKPYFNEYYQFFKKEVDKGAVIKTKSFTKLTEIDKKKALSGAFYDKYHEIEKNKLYIFGLVYEQEVLLIHSPSDTDEQKAFLGYEISHRKGKEGIIEERGALTDPFNRKDETKLAWVVKQSFCGNRCVVPEIEKYYQYSNLSSLFDFSKESFKKQIYTVPISSFKLPSKYGYERLSSLLEEVIGGENKIPASEILQSGKYPVITQEKTSYISGFTDAEPPITDLPLIVFGDHSCAVKFVDKPFVRGADGTQLIKIRTNKSFLKYLYYYLRAIAIPYQGNYERHFKYVKDLRIPIPPDTIQQRIIARCEECDASIVKKEKSIQRLNNQISKLFLEITEESLRKPNEYEKPKLSQVADYITNKVELTSIPISSYISTDNMLPEYGGVTLYDGNPEISSVVSYKKGDTLVSNIRPYLKKIWFASNEGGCSPDVLVFRVKPSAGIVPEFLYYSLHSDAFFEHMMKKTKGLKMPRGIINNTMGFVLTVPKDKGIQASLIAKIHNIEKKKEALISAIADLSQEQEEIVKSSLVD